MRNSFDNKRIVNKDIIINKNDKFNLTIIKPKKELINNKKILFYIPGLNGNGNLVKYFNYNYFDDFYLISYDQRAQGNNNCKPSRNFKKYLNDLYQIINYCKANMSNISKIYIMGESWGSSLCFLFNKYYKNIVDGIIGWNMPYNVIDVSTVNGYQKFKNSIKMILTFFLNINTYDDSPFNEELTNNKLLIRTIKLIKRKKLSNKVILSAWRSFKKSWKYLINNNKQINFLYIQSENDILKNDKIFNKLSSLTNNVKKINKGYHILTFDNECDELLFKYINKFIHK